MKRWLTFAAAALFLAAGCSQSPTQVEDQSAFDEEFGGFTTSSESPGFGDPDLLASGADDEVDPGDANASAIQTDQTGNPDGYHVLALRVIWGQLRDVLLFLSLK